MPPRVIQATTMTLPYLPSSISVLPRRQTLACAPPKGAGGRCLDGLLDRFVIARLKDTNFDRNIVQVVRG